MLTWLLLFVAFAPALSSGVAVGASSICAVNPFILIFNASALQGILQEIIGLLVGGITGIAQGIGEGLSELAQAIFLQTTGSGDTAVTSLSTFGALIVIFAGVSLAVGLSRWVVNFVTSLGARNR